MANKYHGNIPRPDAPGAGTGPSNGTAAKPGSVPKRLYPWKDPGMHQKKPRNAGVKKLKNGHVVSKGL